MQPRLTRHKQQGVTVLEAVISISVFSIGILGMTQLQTYTQNQITDQKQRNIAIWKGQEIIERMKSNNTIEAILVYQASFDDDEFCDDEPSKLCAEYHDGNGEVAAEVCTPEELAVFDSWQTLCDGESSLGSQLDNMRYGLSCPTSPCVAGQDLTLLIAWEAKTAVLDDRLTEQTTLFLSEDAENPEVVSASENYLRQVFRP